MLFGISGTDWLIVAGAVLTWLIFILGVAQLSRFYTRVMEMRKELDANSLAVVNQLKKIQTTLSEVAIEQRRSTRLMLEQIDLKKAELTGEFEIIEEPIPGASRDDLVSGLIRHGHRHARALLNEEDLARLVREQARPGDIVVCLGAGTISTWANGLPAKLG